MPIYEFYCADCYMLFSFFSRRIDTERRPACPRCGRPRLSRQVSAFAPGGHRRDDAEADGGAPIPDESRMERAMESLAQEAAMLDEADPKQAAALMRKFSESTGLSLGEGMEEAVRRLEAGADPEAVEAEFGDRLEQEDPFGPGAGKKSRSRHSAAPRRDPRLYDL